MELIFYWGRQGKDKQIKKKKISQGDKIYNGNKKEQQQD